MHTKSFLLTILFIMAATISYAANGFTLVIDAGHGGHDSGAKGAVSQEKDINLAVALAFGKYVEDNCKDVKVIYTRTTDVFVPLKERANIANRNNADLFVSVHTNALPNGRIARGFEVYTLGMHRAKDNLDVAMRENSVISMENGYQQTYQGFDPKSSESYIMFEFMQSANMEKSVALAKLIEKSVCSTADRENMGVHQAGFLVLRETSMPSCLIELGFITTPDEEEFLNTDEGVGKLAKGIYLAFVDYKNKYHGKVATVVSSTGRRTTGGTTTAAPKPKPVSTPSLSKKTPATTDTTKVVTTPRPTPKPAATPRATTTKTNTNTAKKVTPAPAKPSARPLNTKEPVFKVQIFAVSRRLESGDALFKGHKDAVANTDSGSKLVKYTIGSSNDYNSILSLRKTLLADFPNAYIVAYKDGKPANLSQSIAEYKQNKNKTKK